MIYIKFTYIDSITNISAAKEITKNEPVFPRINSLKFEWQKLYNSPVSVPEFFGTCEDSEDTNVEGVLEVLTKESYDNLYKQELENRFVGKDIISAKQIRLRLLEQGLLDQTINIVKTLPQNLQIEWEYGTELYRKSDLINSIKQAINLNPDAFDEIFLNDDKYLQLQDIRNHEKQLLEDIENDKELLNEQ